MTITEKIEDKAKEFAKQELEKRTGFHLQDEITINSLSELKKELNLGDLDVSKLEAVFKEPIRVTKEKLKNLQANLLGTDEEKLSKLEQFILEKTKVKVQTKESTKDLQKKVAIGAGVVSIAAVGSTLSSESLRNGLSDKISEIKNADGIDKFGKIGEFFEWGEKIFKNVQLFVVTKIPFLASIFGWDKDKIIADSKITKDGIKTETKDVAEDGKEVVEKKAEEAKIILEKKKESLMKDITNRWGVNFNNPKTSKQKFDEIWKKYTSNMENDLSRVKKLDNLGTKDNLISILSTFGKDSFGFILDLAGAGFIPYNAIVAEFDIAKDQAVSFMIASGKELVGLAGSGFEGVMSKISMQEFHEEYSKLDKDQKIALGHIVDRKGAFIMQLAGSVGSMITTGFILYPTFNEGVKFTEYGMKFSNLMGNFEKQAKGFEELYKLTGKSMSEDVSRLRNILIDTNTKTLVTGAYMNAKDSSSFFNEIDKIKTLGNSKGEFGAKVIDSDFIKKFENFRGQPIEKIGSELQTQLRNGTGIYNKTIDGWNSVKTWVDKKFWKGNLSNPKYHIDSLAKECSSYSEGLAEQVRLKGSVFYSSVTKLKQWFKIGEIPGSSQKATLSVNQSEVGEVKKTLSLLIKESPELVKGLFRNAAIIITLTGSVASGKKENEILGSLAEGLFGLVPFVGPIYIFREGFNWSDRQLTHPGYIITATGMLAFDSYELYKILLGSDRLINIGKFVGRPVVMTAELIGGIGQTFNATWRGINSITQAIKTGNTAELLGFCRSWGINIATIVGISIITMVTYKNYDKNSEENIIAEMKKDGFIDNNGNLVEDKLKQAISKLGEDEKRYIAKTLADQSIKGFEKPGESTEFDYKIIQVSGNKIKFQFNDLGTFVIRENIRNLYAKFGFDVEFSYTYTAMKKFAKEFKENGFAKGHYENMMKELGIGESVEKFWNS